MSKMRKFLGVLAAATMTLPMAVPAFATTGVSSADQTILTEIKQKSVEVGIDVDSSSTYKSMYAQVESFLAQNDLSTEQVNALVAAVDSAATKAESVMSANGVSSLSGLSSDVYASLKDTVASNIKTAAAAVGITVSVDTANETATATLTSTGTTVASTSSVIKQTGADLTATFAVAVSLLGAVAVFGVVASKKNVVEA